MPGQDPILGEQLDIVDVAGDIAADSTAIGKLATGLSTDPGSIATLNAEYLRRDGTTTMDGTLTLSGGNNIVMGTGTVAGRDIAADGTAQDVHIGDGDLHYTQTNINHANLINSGLNTHTAIDNHLGNAAVHFTEGSISHANILNIGTNTHAQIDIHIADGTLHFTEASIVHQNISGAGTNTHAQIDTHIGAAAPHTGHVDVVGDTMTGNLTIENSSASTSLLLQTSNATRNADIILKSSDGTTRSIYRFNELLQTLDITKHNTSGIVVSKLTFEDDGNLTLLGGAGIPTADSHLTRKDYVDGIVVSSNIEDLSNVVITGSPAAITGEILKFDGINWINSLDSGLFKEDTSRNIVGGTNTGNSFTTANDNFISGYNAGSNLTSGGFNVLLGSLAGDQVNTGEWNVIIGYLTGSKITAGTANVIIGAYAGPTTDQSNQLFIDNSETDTPLIHGDFSTNTVTINGTLNATTAIQENGAAVLKNVVEDTTPQLGGNMDVNNFEIITPNITGTYTPSSNRIWLRGGNLTHTSGQASSMFMHCGDGYTGAAGGEFEVYAGSGSGGTGGGKISLFAGPNTSGDFPGGRIKLDAGNTTGASNGGYVEINAGTGTAVGGAGGYVTITSGSGNLSSGNINITTGDAAAGVAGYITLQAGTGNSTGYSGGNISLLAGRNDAGAGTQSGYVWLKAANTVTDSDGGSVWVDAGTGIAGAGGAVAITSGASSTGIPGDIKFIAGEANTGNTNSGGNIRLTAGKSAAGITAGSIHLTPGGGNGNTGTVQIHTGVGLSGQAALEFWDDTNTSHTTGNYVALKAPTFAGSPPINITYSLPETDGVSGELLTTDGSGNLSFSDPISWQLRTITTAGTTSALILDDLLIVDATAGNVTIQLHTVNAARYRPLNIKRKDNSLNTIIVQGAGSPAETIDGEAFMNVPTQYDNLTIMHDGIEWFIL